MDNWYVIYRCKPMSGTLQDNLESAGVEFFIPSLIRQSLSKDGNELIKTEDRVMANLVFVKTSLNIRQLVGDIDGLRCPMIDHATGNPAVVPAAEMQKFRHLLEIKNLKATILSDPYQRFKVSQKVRVRAGEFEGVEGYVFRIRGDRKLIISLGDMAVAISGIHHTLLEPVE